MDTSPLSQEDESESESEFMSVSSSVSCSTSIEDFRFVDESADESALCFASVVLCRTKSSGEKKSAKCAYPRAGVDVLLPTRRFNAADVLDFADVLGVGDVSGDAFKGADERVACAAWGTYAARHAHPTHP